MDKPEVGKLIGGIAEKDAIHVAIAPVRAHGRVLPGERVGFIGDSVGGGAEEIIGIADPFLHGPVEEGQSFWMFLFPNTVTSMRHEWEHPAFAVVTRPERSVKSQEWIREYAERCGLSYRDLMAGAEEYLNSGEYLCRGELLDGVYTADEFWDHFTAVTGRVVTEDDRVSFFTCSC